MVLSFSGSNILLIMADAFPHTGHVEALLLFFVKVFIFYFY